MSSKTEKDKLIDMHVYAADEIRHLGISEDKTFRLRSTLDDMFLKQVRVSEWDRYREKNGLIGVMPVSPYFGNQE